MQKLFEIPTQSETAKASKNPPAARGRKLSASLRSKVPAGRGVVRLRSSVNKMVGKEFDRIASALIEKTVAGNMASARMLAGLFDAQNAPPDKKKKKKSKCSAYIQQLASEPEWTGPWEDENPRNASKLPPSDYDLPEDLK